MFLQSFVVFVALSTATADNPVNRGVEPSVRRLVFEEREIEVDTKIGDLVARRMATRLAKKRITLTALWRVPQIPGAFLGLIISPPSKGEYGPQLVVIREMRAQPTITFACRRLYDDDFVNPTFFTFQGRTLLLADHGSEDAYGMIAWSFEGERVRDLGELDVALPPGGDVFTRGASPAAQVELVDGRYIIRIPGPLLLYPQQDGERVLAQAGHTARFCEEGNEFRACGTGATLDRE